jgi:hypothetical protein
MQSQSNKHESQPMLKGTAFSPAVARDLANTFFREAGADCICITGESSLKDGSATARVSGPSTTASGPFEAAYGGALPPMP